MMMSVFITCPYCGKDTVAEFDDFIHHTQLLTCSNCGKMFVLDTEKKTKICIKIFKVEGQE